MTAVATHCCEVCWWPGLAAGRTYGRWSVAPRVMVTRAFLSEVGSAAPLAPVVRQMGGRPRVSRIWFWWVVLGEGCTSGVTGCVPGAAHTLLSALVCVFGWLSVREGPSGFGVCGTGLAARAVPCACPFRRPHVMVCVRCLGCVFPDAIEVDDTT